MSLTSSPGHNINLRLSQHQGLLWQYQACLLSDGTSARPKWSHYIALTNKFPKTLLLPDSLDVDAAYQDFCNTIKKVVKKTIPRGYPNNYIPCWDAECESLYKNFLQFLQGDTALFSKLDRKWRDRWSEAVQSIDFSHSSQKAWSILNNLTGRSRHFPYTVPFQPMLLHLSWLEMENTRLLNPSLLDLSLKKCLTFRGPQHYTE